MKKFSKWFLVILILVLFLAACSNTTSRKSPYPNCKESYFLNKILTRILQEVPENKGQNFNIYVIFKSSNWASINPDTKNILINEHLLLIAKNEAEIAYNIAHEVGHIIVGHSGTHGPEDFKVLIKKENEADRIAIKLMAKIGYNTFSAADIMWRMHEKNNRLLVDAFDVDIEFFGTTNKNEWVRPTFIRKIAQVYHSSSQKNWILFTSKDLKKVKDFCRKVKSSKDLQKYYK